MCIVKRDSFALNPHTKQTEKKAESNHRQFVHQRNTSFSTAEIVTGSCTLLSKERFTVIVPYQEQLIDIFKSLDSKIYGKTLEFLLDILQRTVVNCHSYNTWLRSTEVFCHLWYGTFLQVMT
jgi:hypothetical protein